MKPDRAHAPSVGRSLLAVFAVIAIALAGGGVAYARFAAWSIRQTYYRNLASIADARVQQIQQWRRDELAKVGALARTPGFADGVAGMVGHATAPAAAARLQEYLRLVLTPARRTGALVLALDGRVIASAGTGTGPSIAPASRRAAAAALATGTATLSTFFLDAQDAACLDAAAPIRTATGRTIGVLLLRSDARASLTPRPRAQAGAFGGIDTYVVERDGDQAVVLTDRRVPPDTAGAIEILPMSRTNVAVVQAALGHEGIYQSRSPTTGEIVADMRPVSGSPWFLVTWGRADAQTAAIRRQIALVVGVVAMLILLAGAGVAHQYRRRQAGAYRALYESERQRREGEERLHAIVEAEPECVKVVDRSGNILQMNAAGLAMLEADSLADVQRQPIDAYILPPHREAFHALYASVMNGNAGTLEFEVVGLRGSHRWLETHAVPLRDKNGEVAALLGVTRDVTERRRSQADLLLQSSALNAAADAIVITDRAGTIQWVNSAFVALTGYTVDEAVGRNPRQLVKSGAHDPAFYREMWETILAGRPWRGELTNRRKDGTRYLEEQTITPVRTTHDEITHFVAVKRDISAQRELEAQLLQSQKIETVGRLAGGVAHDFNNLLTVINGTAELLLRSTGESGGIAAELQTIADAGNRAAQLTRQLLAFSRKQMLQVEPLHLNTSLRGMETMLHRMLGEDVQLVLALAEDLDLVRADPGQLDQVILNLVVNARDAMPHGGTLTIRTRNVEIGPGEALSATGEAGRHVMLVIQDTGLGMDDATRERIFEPFFTTKELGRGTGLGLSTVYGIVRQSGGRIDVQSEPGRGTTFTITLPSVNAATLRASTAPSHAEHAGTETVLVVEDEPALRRLTERALRASGYEVLTAETGEEAAATLDRLRGKVDLMMTDVVLPGISGRELAARVSPLHPRLRVLFTSGYTDDTVLRHGVSAQTARFLGKPYTVAELIRRVREALDAEPPGRASA